MKNTFLFVLFISTLTLQAQESATNILKDVNEKTHLLIDNQLIKNDSVVSKVQSLFGEIYTYNKGYKIKVNDRLFYEIGEIKSNSNLYSIMFIQSKSTNNTHTIEFLIAYKKEKNNANISILDASRNRWMELCNDHQTANLVLECYHKDAYYYNRGRLIQGTQDITKEYAYMSNPNYQLKLTPKHIVVVNKTIAFEIGQCSGSYPLPYLLLWEKQVDDKWKILLDSNF